MKPEVEFDAVVVGAGFSGLTCLHELRKYGFSCKVFEAGGGLGGTWYWNCYPGARVDIDCIYYQFHQAEIGRDFHWTERFPSWTELQQYFSHVDRRHNFSRDIQFNTRVTEANFDSIKNQWKVKTSDSGTTKCRFLILCVGAQSKPYRPKFAKMESFCGQSFHTAELTATKQLQFKGKRVAVIGTGASGVQVIQEIGPSVQHLTVLQRTPNTALPMQQKCRADGWVFPKPSDYDEIFVHNLKTYAGVGLDFVPKKCMEATPEEREKLFEKLYAQGGLAFRLATYQDMIFSPEANETVYKFWMKKTRARITDPAKQKILAPDTAPHPFGTKRPCLEQSYFEVFNQPNVDLVDLSNNPIKEVTEDGLMLENGNEIKVDIIVMATGFDSVTGSLLDIEIRNGSGQTLKEHWKDGIRTLVGMATDGFPNMVIFFGPQAPADVANGPTVAKVQTDWLVRLLVWMRRTAKKKAEAKVGECEKWAKRVHDMFNKTLFPLAKSSWQNGSNIPGKQNEPLSFGGGIPAYTRALEEASADDFATFNFN